MNGADPNLAVEGAAKNGHIEVVKLLLDYGGDASLGLGVATQKKHVDIVKLLLQQEGINANIEWEGFLPIDWAKLNKLKECEELIRAAGGKSYEERWQ